MHTSTYIKAFSNTYSDFHQIHRGEKTLLYRVVKTLSGEEFVLKIFDREHKHGDFVDKNDVAWFLDFFKVLSLSASSINGVVKIFDYGVEPFPFILMEFINGEPFDVLMSRFNYDKENHSSELREKLESNLKLLHQNGLYHGFIDSKSIIVSSAHVPVLAGFSFKSSRVCDLSETTNIGNFYTKDRKMMKQIFSRANALI